MNQGTSRSGFITRLSYGMMAVATVLAVLSIRSQLLVAGSFSGQALPGAESTHDVAILERTNWTLLVFMATLWSAFIFASWSLGRRRNWARRTAIYVFGLLLAMCAWNGGLSLLFALGAMRLPFLEPGYSKTAVHGLLVLVTLVLVVCSYLCWRVVLRLRSSEIRREFQRET